VSVPVLGTHPVEMGMQGQTAEIERRLAADPCYVTMFARAFPKAPGVTYAHVAQAIASFEMTLVSRSSPYDRGEMSDDARMGQAVFRRDCAACHKGPISPTCVSTMSARMIRAMRACSR
jgi:cytochrome c peroxidase